MKLMDWKRLMFLWTIGAVVFLTDQLTKQLIISRIPLHMKIEIIPGFFNIVHVRNTGVAFSLFANLPGAPLILSVAGFIAIAILTIIVVRLKQLSLPDSLSFGLILGGAIGNLIDRIRFGSVVDFLDFYIGNYHWPAFNVADSAITCGAILIAVKLLFDHKKGTS